ncbi:MAG: Hsp20/alpha crystallin family protein [Nitrospirae bacterium]|nr:Hsp20/alpha crystallin family protein [Nitrospirota bacterium]
MPRNNLFDDLDNIHWEMERLFHSLFNPKHPFHLLADRRWRPLTDMYEVDDELMIKVEIPGVHKDDISITLEDRLLVIRGTRNIPEQKCSIVYHQMEINYGEFERVLMLPAGYDTEKIKAELKDKEGFLYITINKIDEGT